MWPWDELKSVLLVVLSCEDPYHIKLAFFWYKKWLKGSETGKNWQSNGIC